MKARNRIRPQVKCEGESWMTTGQVANRLGVSPRSVAKWIDDGRLVGMRLPFSKDRRVHPDVVAEFEERHGFNRARNK
jgi:hypothetical protein